MHLIDKDGQYLFEFMNDIDPNKRRAMEQILEDLFNSVKEPYRAILGKSIAPNNALMVPLYEFLIKLFNQRPDVVNILFENTLARTVSHVVVADTIHTCILLGGANKLDIFNQKKHWYTHYGVQLNESKLLEDRICERDFVK